MYRIKSIFRNSWLFPRYIGVIYIRQALEQARKYAKGVLLDVGCGLRQYEDLFSQQVTHYIGIDWPAIPERARPDVIADALHLPLAAAVAQTVLATELMEHLHSPKEFLAEMARVLQAGGCLILSVPFLEPLHEEPRDYYRFTPHSLRLLLENHGFSLEHIWERGGWWSVVLGSFVSQGLYDLANPIDAQGKRRYHYLATAFVIPLCAICQMAGYALDRLKRSKRYTLGYVVMATRKG